MSSVLNISEFLKPGSSAPDPAYHRILDVLPAAVYTTDAEGTVTYCNRAARELAGREPVLGKDKWCVTWKLFLPDGTPLPHDKCPMAQSLRERRPIRGVEAIAERPDGSRFSFIPYPTPILDESGKLLGAVNMFIDITELKSKEKELRSHSERLDTLDSIARTLTSEHNLERIVQTVTDSATRLTGAKFGAFFYNTLNAQGEALMLYTLSGAPRSAFEKFGMPRITPIFEPTFRGLGIVRSDDIRKDNRYGKWEPHRGMPKGHLPVVSYLSAPVIGRDGEVIGGLFFGHDQPGVFSEESEKIVSGIASHAAIAIDNARLIQSAQREIEQRKHAEQAQAVLHGFTDELHRADSLNKIHDAALDAITRALGCDRASILLFDDNGVMNFIAWRGLSDSYRAATNGHSPWSAQTPNPKPIYMENIDEADLSDDLREIIRREGIGALAFIPLVADGQLIGKFMAYHPAPHAFTASEKDLALTIARQLSFSIGRQRGEEALRESERRLTLALNAGKMGAWEWNIQSGSVIWSPNLEEIHGLTPGTFGGSFEDFKRDIHPDDVDHVLSTVQRCLEGGQEYHVAYRIIDPTGSLRWLEAFGRIAFDTSGKPQKLAGVCMDITDRKFSEAQRDLMVAELSHRVKNTLATVISIARQSFTKDTPIEVARAAFDGRIHALAKTHSRLAEGNWSGVSFESALLDELTPYRQADGANIRLSGPAIVLNPRNAVVLGMAYHELATNAAKYGALSSKNGTIHIEWSVTPDGMACVRWIENGGPPVSPPKRSGFGRLLLERALVSDLKGEVNMDFQPEGLLCTIKFPLRENAASAH